MAALPIARPTFGLARERRGITTKETQARTMPGKLCFGALFRNEVRESFVGDVNGKSDETDAYNPETQSFVSFSALNLRVNRHPPKQCGARGNLNETIHSETNKGDAPGNHPCANSDQSFEGIPRNREILKPPSAMSNRLACNRQLTHAASIPSDTRRRHPPIAIWSFTLETEIHCGRNMPRRKARSFINTKNTGTRIST